MMPHRNIWLIVDWAGRVNRDGCFGSLGLSKPLRLPRLLSFVQHENPDQTNPTASTYRTRATEAVRPTDPTKTIQKPRVQAKI